MKFISYVTGVDIDKYAEQVEMQRERRRRVESAVAVESIEIEPESVASKPAEEPPVPPNPLEPPKEPEEPVQSKRSGSITVESDSEADISASILITSSGTKNKSSKSKSTTPKSVRFSDEEEPKSILKRKNGGSSGCECNCTGACKVNASQDSSAQGSKDNKVRHESERWYTQRQDQRRLTGTRNAM